MQINNCPTDARPRKKWAMLQNVISFFDPDKKYNIEKGIGFLDRFDLRGKQASLLWTLVQKVQLSIVSWSHWVLARNLIYKHYKSLPNNLIPCFHTMFLLSNSFIIGLNFDPPWPNWMGLRVLHEKKIKQISESGSVIIY